MQAFTIRTNKSDYPFIYMVFDDGNYKDISTKLTGQYTEITCQEWEEAGVAYNKSMKEQR